MMEVISQLDDRLMQKHRHDIELFDQLTDMQRRAGILHGDRPISPYLRPLFMPRSVYASISAAARTLSVAFEKVTIAAIADESLMTKLGLTEKEKRWAKLEPGYKCVSVNSRLDTFIGRDGFAFLEYNAENPAGIGDQEELRRIASEVPEVRAFLETNPHYFPQPHRHLLGALDTTYREFQGRKEKPTIAIVDWEGVETTAEFQILQEFFESEGYSTRILDPNELEFDGRRLRSESFEIDIFFKRVIIHEYLERFDESSPLFRAMEARAVCMANSFRSKVPHKKASFAVLSDPQYSNLFSASEIEVIRRHIPWTRSVEDGFAEFRGDRVDLLDLLRRDRTRFALKPNDDYGGKGITLGWESSESEWDRALQVAVASDHVVQERVDTVMLDMPVYHDGELRKVSHFVDFDPFLFRGEVEGGMVRLSTNSLVNISRGGGEAALAILENI